MNGLLVVSYGGGVNSTAMLCAMHERGHAAPAHIVFADTGGEKPETYQHIGQMQVWLDGIGWPRITTVRYQPRRAPDTTLEEECRRRKVLPSLAYGFKTCSQKWKRRPFETWWRDLGRPALTLAIGFDADEERRVRPNDDTRINNWFPLIEWNMGRDECLAAIARQNLPAPPKSSCFFCPASRKGEIAALARDHPDLFARALAMEDDARAAGLSSVQGLGRKFAWRDFIEGKPTQRASVEQTCFCADGDGPEERTAA